MSRSTSHIFSVLVFAGYILFAWVRLDNFIAGTLTIYLSIPFLCIWFGDEVGSYTGWNPQGWSITRETPGGIVRLMGWVLLLLPGLIYVVLRMKGINPAGWNLIGRFGF